jgi:hypothetical protein
MLITSLLSSRLPLTREVREAGGLPDLHRLRAASGDQIRFVKAPPQEKSLKGVALGEHTDFVSVKTPMYELHVRHTLTSYINILGNGPVQSFGWPAGQAARTYIASCAGVHIPSTYRC